MDLLWLNGEEALLNKRFMKQYVQMHDSIGDISKGSEATLPLGLLSDMRMILRAVIGSFSLD